jgi:outer membrane protein assembly factor BamB
LTQPIRHQLAALLVAVLFGVSLLPISATAQKPEADWSLFRGNPLQTGVASSTLPERLEALWKFKTKDSIEGAAAIAGGTVYIGSLDEYLYALDLAAGKEKWRYKAGPIKAPTSVRNGFVYVGDSDGMFHCIEAATGKKSWSYETGAEISAGANFSGDAVLFGSGDETLYCLSLEGKERWRFKVPGGPVLGSPAVVDSRTFAAGCDSTLHVLDITNGKEIGSGVDLGGQVGATVAVVGDRLYVGTMSNQVLSVDWKKGNIVWTFESTKRPQPFYASAAATDKSVIVGSRDKHVYALDRKTGKETWSFLTRNKVDSSPVVVGSRVLVGSYDGNLYVLDLAKGTELTRMDLASPVSGSPAVSDNRLVIGTADGTIHCLGATQ